MLAVLLLLALGFGWRLERRLKALKAGHVDFAKAVADLDRAAMRAATGLAELRAATDESVDLLSSRIERARELTGKLERLNDDAAATVDRLATTRREPVERPPLRSAAQIEPRARKAASPAPRAERLTDPVAVVENLILRLSEQERVEPAPSARPAPTPRPTRVRAPIDDDLFEGPASSALRNPTGVRR